jgi:hypothetical protein
VDVRSNSSEVYLRYSPKYSKEKKSEKDLNNDFEKEGKEINEPNPKTYSNAPDNLKVLKIVWMFCL